MLRKRLRGVKREKNGDGGRNRRKGMRKEGRKGRGVGRRGSLLYSKVQKEEGREGRKKGEKGRNRPRLTFLNFIRSSLEKGRDKIP